MAELVFREPGQAPEILPQVHVSPDPLVRETGFVRLRYRIPEDLIRLTEALLRLRRGEDREVQAPMLPTFDPLSRDSRFWPRVFLDLRGRVNVRARSPKETEQTLKYVSDRAEGIRSKALDPAGRMDVPGETPLNYALVGNQLDELRVIAKTALALGILQLGHERMMSEGANVVRDFVLGKEGTVLPVTWLRPGQELREWPDHHIAMLDVRRGRLRAFLVYFGRCYQVDLGEAPAGTDPELLCVAASRRDGTETFLVSDETAREVRAMIAGAVNSTAPPRDTPERGIPDEDSLRA